ncbi:hypothetical protein BJX76DRAFT_364731 [Aspergillus varians]
MVADKSLCITAVSWTLAGVSTVLVGLRLYTRVVVTRRSGWEDLFIAFSLASAILCSALVQVAVSHGLGMHMEDIINADDRMTAAKYTVIAPSFSVVSTTTSKISVAIFLLYLMGQSAKTWQRWFLYILTGVSIAWNVLAIIAIIGFCRPPERMWNPEAPGFCFSLNFQFVAGTSQAAFNAFADLALAVFPVIIFYRVQLPTVKKVSLRVLGTDYHMVLMHVIIICATLPTIPQSYSALIHKRQPYQNAATYRNGRLEGAGKNPPIQMILLADDFVFDPVDEELGGSQEDILSRRQMSIKKTTEVHVIKERRGPIGPDEDLRYFPRVNPFRSPQQSPRRIE